MKPRPWAAALLGLAIILPTLFAFGLDMPRWWTGIPAWLAGMLLCHTASRRAAIQSAVLASLGVTGLGWGAWHGVDLRWDLVAAGNALIIAMLASVSFLRLIVSAEGEHVPKGRKSLAKTALGLHLFGAVINMSMLYIVAHRLTRGRPLDDRQVMLFTRVFGAAAFWSPFFAAMGVALTYAPGAHIHDLMITGAPLAVIAIVITVWQTARLPGDAFEGYPLNWTGLTLPVLLAVVVLIINDWLPAVPVIAIICLIVPPLSMAGALMRSVDGRNIVSHHLKVELPNMPNELVLFLAAGVMAAGTAAVFASFGDWMPFDSVGPLEMSMLLGLMLLLALVGVHPVIAIAVSGTLLAPLNPPPELLASTFLCSWAIGVAISPFSGMNLALQGRFGLRVGQVLRVNLPYGLVMYGAAVLALFAAA
ncbi:MAG: hypothetical protein ACPG4N_04850 [Gammaproteobacteria bacterium]